jgi:L-lysine exporter family protein LysE/ArgO
MIFLEGLALGFAYAMPLGTQNIFVIHEAMKSGLPRSYVTASIVTLMDVSLSLACFYGVGVLLESAPVFKQALMAGGACYLLYTGINLLRKPPAKVEWGEGENQISFAKKVTMAFLLTWANPHALLDGTVLFGGYRSTLKQEDILLFVSGMVLASALWFFSLTSIIGAFRKVLNQKALFGIQVACGIILLALGGKMLSEFVKGFA